MLNGAKIVNIPGGFMIEENSNNILNIGDIKFG